MGILIQELRFAVRGLVKARAFTALAVLSLGLGIGANTAIFTLLDQILLRRLPVRDPEQLALLTMRGTHYGSNWGGNAISYPLYQDLSANNAVFSGMFCRFPTAASLSTGALTERVNAELVSGTYFSVLGVGAALGRTFTPEEDATPGGHALIVLSHDYWRARFAGDPSVLGRSLHVNGHAMTVIGVAAPGFRGVQLEFVPQIFVPMMMKPQMTPLWDGLRERRFRFVNAFGRLEPGVSHEQAQVALQPYFQSVLAMEVRQEAFSKASVEVREAFLKNVLAVLPGGQGRSDLRRQLGTPLRSLLALTAGVLLIACANVAGLLLVRAAGRDKEMAVRLALGAGRARVVRLLLVESALLALCGALFGVGLAFATNHVVLRFMPPDLHALELAAWPDLRVLLFTALVAGATALGFGLFPAWQATRPDLAPTLKDQAGALAGGLRQARFRRVLVSAQVALSLLLLVGAGLFVRTLMNLRDLGPGFPTERLLAFNLDPSLNGYDGERSKAFYQRLSDELRALPGVSEVGLASMGILRDDEWDSSVTVEGYTPAPGEDPHPFMNSIGPGYFATLGVPLLAGRDFTAADVEMLQHAPGADGRTPRVVIVNEKFARHFFGAREALGRHVGFGSDPGTPTDMEIVGVVKDIKYMNLQDEVPVQMFVPYLAADSAGEMTVYLRSTLPEEQALEAARARLRTLDPNLPLFGARAMQARVTDSLVSQRLVAGLSAAFGLLATLLACVGLYGVMAGSVRRRTREIGVRLALGADAGDIERLVLREAGVLLAAGLAAGVPAALALGRALASQLFGVHFSDPPTLAAAVACLSLAVGLAGYVPARRASRVDPVRAIRYE